MARTPEIESYINTTLVPILFEFWKSVQEGIEPAPDKQDVIDIKNEEFENLLISFYELTEKEKSLKDEAKKASEKVIGTISKDLKKVRTKIEKHELRNHVKVCCSDVKITEVCGKESIDYKAAFDAFIGWVHNLRDNATMGERSGAISNFPDSPNMEKYTTAGKSSIKIYFPKKKKDELAENLAEKMANVTLPKGVTVNENVIGVDKAAENSDKTIETTVIVKPKEKLKEWSEMTPEQQTIQAESNTFKNLDTKKVPRGWAGKTREERIKYLRQTAKRKTTSDPAKIAMNDLAEKLENLDKEPETIGGITFEQ